MKVVYDPERDVLQISLRSKLVEETTQIAPGLILDYDEDGSLVGIELRQASRKLDNPREISYIMGASDDTKPKPKTKG